MAWSFLTEFITLLKGLVENVYTHILKTGKICACRTRDYMLTYSIYKIS